METISLDEAIASLEFPARAWEELTRDKQGSCDACGIRYSVDRARVRSGREMGGNDTIVHLRNLETGVRRSLCRWFAQRDGCFDRLMTEHGNDPVTVERPFPVKMYLIVPAQEVQWQGAEGNDRGISSMPTAPIINFGTEEYHVWASLAFIRANIGIFRDHINETLQDQLDRQS